MSLEHDHSFKMLLVGDLGVGKSSLLLRFTTDSFEEVLPGKKKSSLTYCIVERSKHLKL